MKITPINGDTETEGAEYSYRGVKMLVARANNTEYTKRFRVLMKPYEEEIDKGTIGDDKSNEILIKCCAETILVGWEDFTDTDGITQSYSVASAIELLNDDKDAYAGVVQFSKNINNYLTETEAKLVEK